MSNLAVLLSLAGLSTACYTWAFRTLPADHWQVIATVPRRRDARGAWAGLNLTWYGFFTATAYVVAVVVFLTLLAIVPASLGAAAALVAATLACCIPASRWVSRVIDRKPFGFTVAGAYTVGALLLPVFAVAINAAGDEPRILLGPTLAAASIALVVGEGIGRLACISFGCCYGIPLIECPPLVARLLGNRGFRFISETKKAAHEGGLSGILLVPVQAMTTVVLTLTAFAATALYLGGYYRTGFLTALVVSQLWRFASELLRADERGAGKITAYQWMALAIVVFSAFVAWLIADQPAPELTLFGGLHALWSPPVIVGLQALWALVFVYTGCSRTTAATVRLHVCRDRI